MWKSRSKFGIGDPVRAVEAEGHLDDSPPERLDEVEPALELAAEHGGEGLEVGVGPLVDREAGDVAEAGRSPCGGTPSRPLSCFTSDPLVAEIRARSVVDTEEGPWTCEALRETRPPTMSEIDAPTETAVGWLSPEELELVRAHVPLVYVDAVPVRVDGLGGSPTRSAPAGRRRRHDQPDGRLRPGPVRRADPRRADPPPGEGPRPARPARCRPIPAPFTVVEYFPDPDRRVPRPAPPRRQPGVRRAGRRDCLPDPGGARPGAGSRRRKR